MQVASKSANGQPLLEVIGDVDHDASPVLLGAVEEALKGGAAHILLDLASCPYLDSAGVSVILQALKRVKPDGWLGVIGADSNVLRILGIVGLTIDPCFRCYSDVDEARVALDQLVLQ